MRKCTCLLYTPPEEHFGIVPLEAMAASRAVIACNSGGPLETIEEGVTGFLCEASGEVRLERFQFGRTRNTKAYAYYIWFRRLQISWLFCSWTSVERGRWAKTG
mmetsp:Transcript_25585/g.101031  ORF Transcript_25585/g.101031 Transcript_25585/m.101031 type:complete len:104 (+) Transcript_25585:1454-1765(+)